jgi:hypothetical protein
LLLKSIWFSQTNNPPLPCAKVKRQNMMQDEEKKGKDLYGEVLVVVGEEEITE